MKLDKNQLLNAGIILFILFTILSFLVFINLSPLATADYKVTVFSQKIIPDLFILPFSTFSVFGSAEFTGIFLLIISILLLRRKAIYALCFFVILGIIEILGKTYIHQPGPPLYFHKTSILLGLPSSGISHDFFAYPSGHSARTAFVSGILILVIWLSRRLSKEMKIILICIVLIFDLIMFLSRVYLGEHWTSDVIGGILLGGSLALITSIFFNFKVKEEKH